MANALTSVAPDSRAIADQKEADQLIAELDGKGVVPISPPECAASRFGCCPDGVSKAAGDGQKGCRPINNPSSMSDDDDDDGGRCETSHYGCCPDGSTPRLAHEIGNLEGCPSTTMQKEENSIKIRAERMREAVEKRSARLGGSIDTPVEPPQPRRPVPQEWQSDIKTIEARGDIGDAYAHLGATGAAAAEPEPVIKEQEEQQTQGMSPAQRRKRLECIKEHWRGQQRKEDTAQGHAHWKWATGC